MQKKQNRSEFLIKEMDVCMLNVNGFPNTFVRINWMWADEKQGWWNVNMTKLGLPLEHFTWKLDDKHVHGEPFEMNGAPMQLQIMDRPTLEERLVKKPEGKKITLPSNGRVVTLFPKKSSHSDSDNAA